MGLALIWVKTKLYEAIYSRSERMEVVALIRVGKYPATPPDGLPHVGQRTEVKPPLYVSTMI